MLEELKRMCEKKRKKKNANDLAKAFWVDTIALYYLLRVRFLCFCHIVSLPLSACVEEDPFPPPHIHAVCLIYLHVIGLCASVCECACTISVRQVLCHFVCVQMHDYKLLITLADSLCRLSLSHISCCHFCTKITQPVHIQYSYVHSYTKDAY